jgi:hypothetical protein
MDTLRRSGCAKIATMDGTLEFDANWTHVQVDAWLQELFPVVFQYVYRDYGEDLPGDQAPWVLLIKENCQLHVVGVPKPNGHDLLRYKGRDKAGVSESHIFIGTFYQRETHL